MSFKMVVIVTPEEIAEATINQDLIDLADTESGKATLEKYEKIVANKIRAKIDAEQFKNGDTYDIPEDLKIAAVSLIDNFYTYAIVEGQSAASKKVTSRKIDDFSETFSESTSPFTYFWIPTDGDILDILKKYMHQEEWGFWNVNIR